MKNHLAFQSILVMLLIVNIEISAADQPSNIISFLGISHLFVIIVPDKIVSRYPKLRFY